MSDTFDPHALDNELEQIDRGGDVAGWTPAHRDDGGPAFPRHGFETASGRVRGAQAGMTLRDYFAAHASEEDIAEYRVYGFCEDFVTREEARYAYADAMLKARAS